ncbi:hypothetical protein OXYTRIMIC_364 [Oxytricha trifallax]|uniref:Uncharacterized protein n=1 Tax=Oxytricha trifallax TaxID=1172189 RepID=A0A073HZ63_9SPIT|nr:hypothetical protein OXYTRIMIC_364 [Oxytricha trifallax]
MVSFYEWRKGGQARWQHDENQEQQKELAKGSENQSSQKRQQITQEQQAKNTVNHSKKIKSIIINWQKS